MKQCVTCARWWHTVCVGLLGLKEPELSLLKNWNCPLCYTFPDGMQKEKHDKVMKDLTTVVQAENEKLLNEIKNIKNSVTTPDNILNTVKKELNENLEKQTMNWGNLFKSNRAETAEVITQVISENSTKVLTDVVNSSKQRMDADKMEREQRKCNVVIRDVPEPTERLATDKMKRDRAVVCQILSMEDEEIIKVRRAGPPIGSYRDDKRTARPLIITVTTPDIANSLHDYGRGTRRVSTDRRVAFWVNPDLIKADRDANFRARDAARLRRSGRLTVVDTLENSTHESREGSPHSEHSNRSHSHESRRSGRRSSTSSQHSRHTPSPVPSPAVSRHSSTHSLQDFQD